MICALRGVFSTAFRPMAKTCEVLPAETPAWYEPVPMLPRVSIQFALRPMCSRDLNAVVAIEQRAYAFPWVFDLFEDCLHAGYSCWVCEGASGIQAYGIMSVGAGECHILNLCVVPECQRHGIGRYLMTHLLHVAQRRHTDTAFLEVRSSNHAALALYLSMGFNEIGVRRAYYPGTRGREDAIMLARSL